MLETTPFAATFLQEAADQLALIEEIILEVEENPQDGEAINRLFRVFHTVKGSGAMFGFDQVAEFTHHVETALDKVRAGLLPVSKELVDVILAAKDQISAMLGESEGVSSGRPDARPQLIARLQALSPACTPAQGDPALGVETRAPSASAVPPETRYHIRFSPEPGLLARGGDPAALLADLRALGECTVHARTEAIPPLEQLIPDVCGFSWDIGLTTDRSLDAIKDVFIFVEDGSQIVIEAQPATAPVPAAGAQARAPQPGSLPPDLCCAGAPAGSAGAIGTERVINGATGAVQNGEAKATGVRKPSATDGSVRVPSARLDRLVTLLGEMVMNQSRLSQVASSINVPVLAAPVEELQRLVAELRDNVLGIRMMPIGATFNRFKRLLHDLSAELGKEIDLVTEGAETELDKTVLDQLGDPLVHLIRNSIGHGIEAPEVRERNGKPRRGTIRLSAMHVGSSVIVTIQDDGKGLDAVAIRAKAVEKKLIAPDAALSEKEIFNLIFLPGLSTAKQVTSVSGRGVGMDVVKRQIDALRGTVAIRSELGSGTTISLTLPLTLAIIDGLLVSIGVDQFIIPMSVVTENVELSRADRGRSNGRNVVAVRGELIPYVRLRELFGELEGEPDIEKIVIVRHEEHRVGLVVDRVLGSHQTVIQSLGKFYRNIEIVSGATIMGDGRVALIFDLGGLIRAADARSSRTDPTASVQALERSNPSNLEPTTAPCSQGAFSESNL